MEAHTHVALDGSGPTQHGAERRSIGESPLTIRSEREGPTHLIEVFGDLDIATAPRLSQELHRVEAEDAEQVLLDLSGLRFIDSAGVRVLMGGTARFRSSSTRFHMFRGAPGIERMLSLLCLDHHLPFLDRA
jgi:anti-sigma B factor antagonist